MNGPAIERAQISDLDEIVSLFRRGYAGTALAIAFADEERARSRWLHVNTRYPHVSDVSAWVCRTERGIVAHVGATDADAVVDAAVRRIAWARDLIVDPEARGGGLATRLISHLVERCSVLFLGGMNREVQRIYRRLGYRDNGALPLYVNVLRSRDAAHATGWPAPLRAAFAVAVPLLQRSQGAPARTTSLDVVTATSFDGFDQWWLDVEQAHPRVIRRTAETMAWRYLSGIHDHQILVARRRADVRGYAVLRRAVSRGIRAGSLVEVLVCPGDSGAADALIAAVVEQMRGWDAVFVRCITLDQTAQSALAHAGWLRVPSPVGWMVAESSVRDPAFARGGWMINGGDSDFDFI